MRIRAALVLGALGAVLALPAHADSPGLEVVAVDTSAHPDVEVTVTAPAALAGEEVPAEAFTVLEDQLPRPVTVTPLSSDDLDVVLLVDTSGSMLGEPLAAARDAAATFISRMPAEVDVSVMTFGTEPVVAADFTSDAAGLAASLDGLVAAGETAMYDAVRSASVALTARDATRRVVVLLTDGGDTASTTTLDELILDLSGGTVQLNVVELSTEESDPEVLLRMANAAGGQVASTTDPAVLSELFGQIAARLVNRYALAFESAANGTTRIEVQLAHGDVAATSTHIVRMPFLPIDDTPAPLPELQPEVLTVPAFADQALVLGAAAVFTGLAVLLVLAAVPRHRSRRLAAVRDRGLEGTKDQVVDWVDQRMDGDRRSGLDRRLEAAALHLRPAEWVVLVSTVTLAVLALGLLAFGPLSGLLLALLVPLGARLYLSARMSSRRDAFAGQLAESLQLLTGSLRAGYGIMQAMEALAREIDDPAATEFRRVIVEVRLGRDLDEALDDLAGRMRHEDLEWVVQAIEIHRDVGGDLAEVLDAVANTVRERDEVRGRIRALSAEGRFSAWVMLALPIVMAFMLQVSRPDYLQELTTHAIGWLMLFVGVSLLAVGGVWIRRLVRLVF